MFVYADNAATTKMSKTAIDAMLPYLTPGTATPRAFLHSGQKAEARRGARNGSRCLGAEARRSPSPPAAARRTTRPFFRGGHRREEGQKHIISTAFEHHAVLHTLKKLEKYGYEITLLDVHENGIVTPEQVRGTIREDTCLVTVMYANNEIGTIQPIAEIGAVCREKGRHLPHGRGCRRRAMSPST